MMDHAEQLWRHMRRQAEIDLPPTEPADAYATYDALAFDPAELQPSTRRSETQGDRQGQGGTDVESAEQN